MGKRKIAIMGAAATKEYAPYDEKGWEFWSMNNLYLALPVKYITRWYELHVFEMKSSNFFGRKVMHRRGAVRYKNQRVGEYLKEIANLDVDVYMRKKWKSVPRSKLFPFKAIMKKYGEYFGCSFAWMIAHALYEHEQGKEIDTIGFYGVELGGLEYFRQRPSTEYFIGKAEGMGIKIDIPSTSQLLKMPFIYAYDENFLTIDELYVNPPQSLMMMMTYMQEIIERKST